MWNDKETDVDLLGHERIAQTVIEVMNDNNLRPLTIGIYGDWGVGKSSVLSIIEKNVKANQGEIKSHCISFNGWLFQGYEDAKSALMETVVFDLAALQPRDKKIQSLAKSLIKRINWLKVAKTAASATVAGLSGIPVYGVLQGVSEIGKKAKEILEPDGEKEADSVQVKIEDKESYFKDAEETTTSQIHAFRKEFKELIDSSKVDHVIILVDDLDRCLPKSVIQILEAIRLFLFVEGTTFVISADEKMIEYAVREHFPNLPATHGEYTKNYLEKLIQIPIRIPTLNKLQTGNYIKFLMLQNHLKHNYKELKSIYDTFNAKKRKPYDGIELTYKSITEALGSNSPDLREPVLVADQLSPTLAVGLKGNPRNIKRFLNTLFLRMRIAKIYGLEEIKLNILAKLMLLERFQTDKFDLLVEEISSASDGSSQMIKDCEKEKQSEKKKGTIENVIKEDKAEQSFNDWIKLEPKLAGIDLRPYIFISKEKAIGFDSDGIFPEHLTSILESLSSSSQMSQATAAKKIVGISLKDATILFDKLENESRSVEDLKNVPTPVKGLLKIVESHHSLETRLVTMVGTYPPTNIGPWAVTELSGLKNPEAITAFQALLTMWSTQEDNKALKSIATQTLRKKD